jgi:anti-sigma regulatory factor (Ser/Thr protein kinase)
MLRPPGKKGIVKASSTIYFRSDPALFRAVRRFAAQFVTLAGGSEEDAAEVEIATGEVLANAYQHAYRKTHGPLQLDLSYDAQKVEIAVHDEGGTAPGTLVIPSTLAEGNEHRGLYLVGKLIDDVDILHPRHERGGTTVRMVKHVNKLLRLISIVGLS